MPAPNELPRHGRADQACPTENEHAHDLPLLWKPAHWDAQRSIQSAAFASSEYCGAARTSQKVANKPGDENFFAI